MAGYIGNSPSDSSVRIARQTYTTTGSQTDFTFTAGYDPGYIDVYVNGVKQTEGTNFTANDGSIFSIINGVGTGNTVTASAYKAFNLANVSLSEVTDVDNLIITGQITAATGDIGIATITASGIDAGVGIVTAASFVGSGSGLTGVASTDNITTSTPAEFQQINVSGIATVGVATLSTSVVVGSAVTVTATAITVDPAVTATFSGDINFQGGNYNITRSRANSSIDFDDNAKARFGTSNDLEIWHNATNSHIRNQTGVLIIDNDSGSGVKLRPKIGEEGIVCTTDGSTALYHDGTKKFETSATGATVTGDVTATTFVGALTGNATGLSGTPTISVGSITGIGITVAGVCTVAQGTNLNGYKVEEGVYDTTALNGEFDFELENGHVQTHTGTTAGTFFPDFRVSSSQSLSSVMDVGDVIACTLMVAASDTAHYCTAGIKIDDSTSNVTINWIGSSAPTAGKGAGYDIYSFTIQKTAATPAYLVIVNATDAG